MLAASRPLPARQLQVSPLVRAVVAGVVAYVLAAPLLAVLHESIVLGTAYAIGDLTWTVATGGLLRALPLDPIYTSAMLLTLGGIEPRGLALAGPFGTVLHSLWPALFQPPTLVAPHAWASAVVAPGSTIVSRWLCSIVADSVLIGLGLMAIRYARHGQHWLAVVGAIVQAHVLVTHLIDVPPDLVDVEAAGIPFAVAMIVSGDVEAGPRLAETLERLMEPQRDAILGLGMVVLAYLPVLALALGWQVARVGWRLLRAVRRHGPTLKLARAVSRQVSRSGAATLRGRDFSIGLGRAGALTILALMVAVSPLGDLADAQTRFLSASLEGEGDSAEKDSALSHAGAGGASTSGAAPAASPVAVGPSVVAVTGTGYRYQYTVNGVPQVIRGIGYNVRYRRLPDDERARRLDRDFAELKRSGVNTVFGWEPTEFDMVLMDAAHRHGLGVAPPFDLSPDEAYGDPMVRARITAEVLDWVKTYRDHPALRMWAIGNEVLHKLVYPSWMPIRSDPAWEQRARDFAAFYVELIDAVRAADPNHPIVHRDAEDAYLTWLRDAFQSSERRPWFIYGVNAYTPRLGEILTSWPHQDWDVPLLVSEFAPGGMSPADRPQGLRSMWRMIRGASGWVLGGAVYAWTTDGPEEVDRVFGLVDEDGQPVDGAFAALGSLYRGGARQAEAEPLLPGQGQDERVWSFARQAIGIIQEGRSTDLLPAVADTSIMGDVNAVAQTPFHESELMVRRVRDPRRVAWARESGIFAEWWVSWFPPSTPHRKLTFMVQERQNGDLGVGYIYHGPR